MKSFLFIALSQNVFFYSKLIKISFIRLIYLKRGRNGNSVNDKSLEKEE